MKIKSIRIRKVNDSQHGLKGVASVSFCNGIVIHNIQILEDDNRMFLNMPTKRFYFFNGDKDGVFLHVAHPINNEGMEELESKVFEAYNNIGKDEKSIEIKLTDENEPINVTNIIYEIPRYPNLPQYYKKEVTITIDNQYCIRGIKIFEMNGKLYVAFPSVKVPTGEYKDVVHPTISEVRQNITDKILKGYRENYLNNKNYNDYFRVLASQWIENIDYSFFNSIIRWTQLLKEDECDEEESKIINNTEASNIARCIEQYLKGVVLYKKVNITIPDEIKNAYFERYGEELEISSDKEKLAFITGKEPTDDLYPTLKKLKNLTGNQLKRLRAVPANQRIISAFTGKAGHNIANLISLLDNDDRNFLFREICFNSRFNANDLPNSQEYVENMISNPNYEKDYGFLKFSRKLTSYPNDINMDKESLKRLQENFKKLDAFYILFEKVLEPETSDAFVEGRYVSDDYIANLKMLYMLCIASRKLVNNVFENSIDIGKRKMIFPDNESKVIFITNKKFGDKDDDSSMLDFEPIGNSCFYRTDVDIEIARKLSDKRKLPIGNPNFSIIYQENDNYRILNNFSNITKDAFQRKFRIKLDDAINHNTSITFEDSEHDEMV